MSDEVQPHYGEPGGTQFPITTALTYPDHDVKQSLGMVFGVVVRSMGIARGIGAALKSLAGGEVKLYTRLVEDSRRSRTRSNDRQRQTARRGRHHLHEV